MSNRKELSRFFTAIAAASGLFGLAPAAHAQDAPAAAPAAAAPSSSAAAASPSTAGATPSDVAPPNPAASPATAEQAKAAQDAALAAVGTPKLSPADASFYSANSADAEATSETTYPKLEFSGFTDFSFVANVSAKDSPLRKIAYQFPSFSIGNLNLYMNAALAENWKLLAEVRFLYLPQGNADFPTTTTQQVVPYDASALDYADDQRALTWGGIQIQRVQIDFTPHPLLNFRVGQFLTPVGIWNVDHGSPTVIGVYRPYIIGEGLFPERQTGLQVFGEWSGDSNLFGYAATLSNGRGPSDAYADLDNNKGIGGRLYWTNNDFGSLMLGVSGYKGTYSSRNREYGLQTSAGQTPELAGLNPLTLQYREESIAADLRWQYHGLLVQGEAMQHDVVYTNGFRPGQNGLIFADYRDRGYYALAGYRLPWFGIMPFATFEGYNFASQPFTPPANAESIGLNIRPEPTVVIKLQYHVSQLGSDSSPQPYRGTLKRILTQLAVAF
ncbi:MAG TPA: hypothetical protein VHW01_15115 [Polyangiaceae bacterium]|nr:hypothetical protein [Polyangiaceae bacterium]